MGARRHTEKTGEDPPRWVGDGTVPDGVYATQVGFITRIDLRSTAEVRDGKRTQSQRMIRMFWNGEKGSLTIHDGHYATAVTLPACDVALLAGLLHDLVMDAR